MVTWVFGLPVAVVPLWQLEQVPVTALWSKVAGVQALVVWQALHWAEVVTWVFGLPVAEVPLWQLEQVPVMPLWLKFAGVQAAVEWQSLH